jgi:hypothetical protein
MEDVYKGASAVFASRFIGTPLSILLSFKELGRRLDWPRIRYSSEFGTRT